MSKRTPSLDFLVFIPQPSNPTGTMSGLRAWLGFRSILSMPQASKAVGWPKLLTFSIRAHLYMDRTPGRCDTVRQSTATSRSWSSSTEMAEWTPSSTAGQRSFARRPGRTFAGDHSHDRMRLGLDETVDN